MIGALLCAYALGTVAYPLGSWLIEFARKHRPIRWNYRTHCKGCAIRERSATP